MRKLLFPALAAAMAIPTVAVAHDRDHHDVSRGELRYDRRDVREEGREYRDAYRYGNRGDIREERREYNDARREYRDDQRDWHHRRDYDARRAWGGHGQDRYRRLPATYGFNRWVRRHDDALLIDTRTGRVRDVIRGFYW
jgi:hypothetical protein